MPPEPEDVNAASRLAEDPVLRGLISGFPPPAARRILQAIFLEAADLGASPEARGARDARILGNARALGEAIPTRAERAFLLRHRSLQALRQAEEVLCTIGDVERQVAWGTSEFRVSGLQRALSVSRKGRGAVVVSAHLGPLVYYIPMLVYYLSGAGQDLELLAVMNEPREAIAGALRDQVARFSPHHGMRFGLLAKSPGGELDLWRDLDRAVGRGAWVLMQIDALTGGRSVRPLKLSGRDVCLPGAWGAARLAVRHGAPALPVVARRMRSGGVRLVIESPVERSGAPASPVERARPAAAQVAQELVAVLERWVRRDVADWGLLAEVDRLFPREE